MAPTRNVFAHIQLNTRRHRAGLLGMKALDLRGEGAFYSPDAATFLLFSTLIGAPPLSGVARGSPGGAPLLGDWDVDGLATVGM